MNSFKRSYTSSKGNGAARLAGSKPKESLKLPTINGVGRYKPGDVYILKSENILPIFPIVKQTDNARLLPRYSAVLGRSSEDGVGMEDLDQLQQDLEKLLSTTAVRHRLLRSEFECIDKVEERRKTKKGKPYDKQQPLKRKRPDEKNKYKEIKNGTRFFKTKYNLPINNFVNDLSIKREVPKVSFPKNDTSDKFWLSVEPFCTGVTKDDVVFLDDLVQECSQDIDIKIPDIGDHYAIDWSEDLLGHEKGLSNSQRNSKTKTITFNNELKKNGINAMVDTFSSPLTQRLLAALIEEKVVTKIPSINDKLKPSDFCLAKTTNNPRNGICMDRRLRKELIEQGILDVEDLPKSISPDDDILLEIKKCAQELRSVNEKNVSELNKLRTIIAKDLRRQDVKEALDKVDNQVMDMYNKILINKQKQAQQPDEETYDKLVCSKHDVSEFDDESNHLIQQQVILHKELTELTNATITF